MSEKCCLCGCGTEKMPLVITDGGLYKHFNQAACHEAMKFELSALQKDIADLVHANDKEITALQSALTTAQEENKVLREAAQNVINQLPEGEIELAREVWGNTNARIIKDAFDRLKSALNGGKNG